ncbi:MAG: hypothetical protein S4CHLAM123_01950 [Chlamydiales bacterium]|nr:hypothetical protein [Chlamydiales bacterium]
MFGMGSDKKKSTVADYAFDLEEDLKDPSKLRATKELIEERIVKIKNLLRAGDDQKHFDQLQTLLHGYLAVQKVIQRVNRKMF